MANLPYFPFYPSDWLSSPRIMCLTLAEQGAYIRLLCVCWMSGDCSLPIDQSKLSTLSGLPIDQLGPVQDLFRPHPTKSDALTNERLYKEWEKAHWISESRSKAGRKSGKSRRTHVQQVYEQTASKKATVADKSEVRYQKSDIRSQKADLESQEEKTPLTPQGVSVSDVVSVWNSTEGLPQAMSVTGAIKKTVEKRIKERQDLLWFKELFQRVSRSDFLSGRKTDFAATIDWVLGPKNLVKILNGNYDNRSPPTQVDPNGFLAGMQAFIERG